MSDNVFEFEWAVRKGDLEWVKAWTISDRENEEQREGWYLTDRRPLFGKSTGGLVEYKTDSVPLTRYRPLDEHTGLFKEFANTDPSKESIVRFANTYGFLGSDRAYTVGKGFDFAEVITTAKPGAESGPKWFGERLESWEGEIRSIREMVSLWELIVDADTEALEKRIEWADDPDFDLRAIYYNPEDSKLKRRKLIASSNGKPSSIDDFAPGDMVGPAKRYLETTVNWALYEKASPQLSHDARRDRSVFVLTPHSLLGAIWMQFGNAIACDENIRQCDNCGKWYRVAKNVRKSARVYCSDSCRTISYRRRRQDAADLFESGMSLEEIADKLGSTIETVNKWVRR